jgi:putative (di)nucleoside polyphosphate hydrolase
MIDNEGYRANVGIVITNGAKQLFWARRAGNPYAWQFPQGGLLDDESPLSALYRELYEETGLTEEHVKLITQTENWLHYDLPKHLVRHHSKPLCIGQKQLWYLLELTVPDSHIQLDTSATPEFDQWRWVDYGIPLEEVIDFKFSVYETVLKEFAKYVNPD